MRRWCGSKRIWIAPQNDSPRWLLLCCAFLDVGLRTAAVAVALGKDVRCPSFRDQHLAVVLRQLDEVTDDMARQVDAVDVLRQPTR